MHLVLTGATGLVGSAVLHQMLTTPAISKISILSRRVVPQAEGHAKANVIIHKDYASYPDSVLEQLKDVDGVVWAQGVSVTEVSKEEYNEITITYPLTFARNLTTTVSNASPSKLLNFVYISGAGASTTPGITTSHYGLIKGRAELALLALPQESPPTYANLRPWSLRPAVVDPRAHKEIHKFIPVLGGWKHVAQNWVGPVIGFVKPSFMAPTRELAGVAVEMALGRVGGVEGVEGVSGDVVGGRIVENRGIRRIAATL